MLFPGCCLFRAFSSVMPQLTAFVTFSWKIRQGTNHSNCCFLIYSYASCLLLAFFVCFLVVLFFLLLPLVCSLSLSRWTFFKLQIQISEASLWINKERVNFNFLATMLIDMWPINASSFPSSPSRFKVSFGKITGKWL